MVDGDSADHDRLPCPFGIVALREGHLQRRIPRIPPDVADPLPHPFVVVAGGRLAVHAVRLRHRNGDVPDGLAEARNGAVAESGDGHDPAALGDPPAFWERHGDAVDLEFPAAVGSDHALPDAELRGIVRAELAFLNRRGDVPDAAVVVDRRIEEARHIAPGPVHQNVEPQVLVVAERSAPAAVGEAQRRPAARPVVSAVLTGRGVNINVRDGDVTGVVEVERIGGVPVPVVAVVHDVEDAAVHRQHVGGVDVEERLAARGVRRVREILAVKVDALLAELAVLNADRSGVVLRRELEDRHIGPGFVPKHIDPVEHECLAGRKIEPVFVAPRLVAGVGADVGIFRFVASPRLLREARHHRPVGIGVFRHPDEEDVVDFRGVAAGQECGIILRGAADDPRRVVAEFPDALREGVQRRFRRSAVAVLFG